MAMKKGESKMKKVKFGVLGISNHFVKRIFFPVRGSDKVEIYAVASRSGEKAEEFAEAYGVKKWYPSYEKLLEDEEIEAVYIPLPNHLHAKYSMMALSYGKHVLCEKPLGLNISEVEEMFASAQKNDKLLMEAFMYKFHPQWKRIKKLIMSRELGEVRSINCHFSYYNCDLSNVRNVPEYGGGVLLDIGVYAVSSARFALGKEPKRVVSVLRKSQKGVDDLVSGILDFESAYSTFTVAGTAFPYQNVTIYGSAGIASVDIPFNTYGDVPVHVQVTTSIGHRELTFEPVDHYLLEFEYFADSIRGKRSILKFYDDSLANMKIVDALFKSTEVGTWVKIEAP